MRIQGKIIRCCVYEGSDDSIPCQFSEIAAVKRTADSETPIFEREYNDQYYCIFHLPIDEKLKDPTLNTKMQEAINWLMRNYNLENFKYIQGADISFNFPAKLVVKDLDFTGSHFRKITISTFEKIKKLKIVNCKINGCLKIDGKKCTINEVIIENTVCYGIIEICDVRYLNRLCMSALKCFGESNKTGSLVKISGDLPIGEIKFLDCKLHGSIEIKPEVLETSKMRIRALVFKKTTLSCVPFIRCDTDSFEEFSLPKVNEYCVDKRACQKFYAEQYKRILRLIPYIKILCGNKLFEHYVHFSKILQSRSTETYWMDKILMRIKLYLWDPQHKSRKYIFIFILASFILGIVYAFGGKREVNEVITVVIGALLKSLLAMFV